LLELKNIKNRFKGGIEMITDVKQAIKTLSAELEQMKDYL
jgi:hypothetical protein